MMKLLIGIPFAWLAVAAFFNPTLLNIALAFALGASLFHECFPAQR